MSRLLHAATGEALLAIATGSTTGLSVDAGVTVNGHSTLKYDPAVALGSRALTHTLQGGFNRLWARILFRPSSTLYNSGEPAPGSGPLPLTSQVSNGLWTARAGLWEAYDDAGSNRYRGIAKLTSGAESLSASHKWNGNGDTIGKPTIQGLGWQSYMTLVERTQAGGRVRLRAWRKAAAADPTAPAVLVLDRELDNTALVDFWLAWTLSLDTIVYGAGNEIHIGEVTLWDAERDPDPYRLLWLFSDGFSQTALGISPLYEYGINCFHQIEGSAKTGHIFLECRSSGQSFAGKDLRHPEDHFLPFTEPEVAIGVWFRAWRLTADKMLCSFRVEASSELSMNRGGSNIPVELVSIWHRSSDRKLELRFGTTVYATSPNAIELVAGDDPAEFVHLWIDVGFGETNGFLVVKKDGVEWWRHQGQTADDDGLLCEGICLGTTPVISSTSPGMNFNDLVVSRGGEFRLAQVEVLPPVLTGENTGWSQTTSGAAIPAQLGVPLNGGYQDWMELWTNLQVEPSPPEVGTLFTPGPLVLDKRVSIIPAKLPDRGCGGLPCMIIPQPDLRVADAESDVTGWTMATYVRHAGSSDLSPPLTGLRKVDPAPVGGDFAAFAGADGLRGFVLWGWPINPFTGDSWDPSDLPQVGVSAIATELELSSLVAQVILVRPSNEAPTIQELSVMGLGDWRLSEAAVEALGRMRGLPTENLVSLWVMALGDWRPLPMLLLPYCDAGPESQPFLEQFANDTFYSRVWSPILSFDPSKAAAFTITGGRLEIYGPASFIAQGFELGLRSNGFYTMPGGFVAVEIPESIGGIPIVVDEIAGRHQVLYWGNLLEFVWLRFHNGFLQFGTGSGNGTVLVQTPFLYGVMRHWRLRHDDTTDELVAEYSSDGVAWSEVGRDDNGGAGWTPDDMIFCDFGIYTLNTTSGAAADPLPAGFKNFRTSPLLHF